MKLIVAWVAFSCLGFQLFWCCACWLTVTLSCLTVTREQNTAMVNIISNTCASVLLWQVKISVVKEAYGVLCVWGMCFDYGAMIWMHFYQKLKYPYQHFWLVIKKAVTDFHFGSMPSTLLCSESMRTGFLQPAVKTTGRDCLILERYSCFQGKSFKSPLCAISPAPNSR